MAGLQVDPSSLRNAAAGFVSEADELAKVGVVDEAALAQDHEAHGEIYGKLKGVYRQARQSIADRFAANGDGRRAHADKLNAAADGYEGVNTGLARKLTVTGVDGAPDEGSGLAPNGVGRIDDFQGGASNPSRGVSGPYDTGSPSGPAQVRPPEVAGVGRDAPVPTGLAPVRPAGHVEPLNPSASDYDRLYPKLFPQPLPGQPGGGTWADVAPSAGDATHPPHGGLIPNKSALPGEYTPNSRPPEFTEVWPNTQGGYDIMAPGIDPTGSPRTDGTR